MSHQRVIPRDLFNEAKLLNEYLDSNRRRSMKYVRKLQNIGVYLILIGVALITYVSYSFGWTVEPETSINETLQCLPGVAIACTGMVLHGMGLLALAIRDRDDD